MISIVIPTKGRSVKLSRALSSVAMQTETSHETIVIDDGSSPEEADAIKSCVDAYPKVRLVRLEHSVGAPAARNLGVEVSSGAIVAFLDSDDWWASERLAAHAQILQRTGAVLSYNPGRLTRSTAEAAFGTYGKPIDKRRSVEVALAGWSFIGGCSSVCVTRAGFDAVLGFDPALPSCQDWDLWRRLARVGQFAFVPEPLTFVDVGPHERITTSQKKVEAGHRAIEGAVAAMVMRPTDRRYVRARQKWVRAELAARFGEPWRALGLVCQSLLVRPTLVVLSRLPALLLAGLVSRKNGHPSRRGGKI